MLTTLCKANGKIPRAAICKQHGQPFSNCCLLVLPWWYVLPLNTISEGSRNSVAVQSSSVAFKYFTYHKQGREVVFLCFLLVRAKHAIRYRLVRKKHNTSKNAIKKAGRTVRRNACFSLYKERSCYKQQTKEGFEPSTCGLWSHYSNHWITSPKNRQPIDALRQVQIYCWSCVMVRDVFEVLKL